MKKGDKYLWTPGGELPVLDEHSQTKHQIIADYLRRYVLTYMSKAQIELLPLTIVDGFSGGGKYVDILTNQVVDGSPFLILEAIKEAEILINEGRTKKRTINAEYHFVDKAGLHLDFLEQQIRESSFNVHLDSQIYFHKNTFQESSKLIIERIKKRNTSQRSIFILDQYAYIDVPFDLINQIMRGLNNSEIILTFGFDSLQSFISDTAKSRKTLSRIGLEDYIAWERLATFKEEGMWEQAIQEQLANAILVASGARHITLFFIKPKKGWSYWLVHLSKVYRARDVMMDIHWEHSNTSTEFSHYLGDGIFSLGYKAIETPGQSSFDFKEKFDFGSEGKERCVKSLSEEIPRMVLDQEKGEVVFNSLVDRIGSRTPAAESHIKQALQFSVDAKELVILTEAGGRRNSTKQIKPSDRVIHNPQKKFIL